MLDKILLYPVMKGRKTLAIEGEELIKFKTIHEEPGVDMVRNGRKLKKHPVNLA